MVAIRIALAAVLILVAATVVAQTGFGIPSSAPTQAEEDFARGLALYRGSDGSRPDPAAAAAAFRRAAEAGHSAAAEYLALQYARGEGVPRSSETALTWIDRALAGQPEGPERVVALANRAAIVAQLTAEQRRRVAAAPPAAAAVPPQEPVPAPAPEPVVTGTAETPSPPARQGWRVVSGNGTGSARLQLGAFRDSRTATRAMNEVRRRFGDVLGGMQLSLDKSNERIPLYRIRSNPVPVATAEKTCAGIRAKKADCLVVAQ